MSFKRSVGDRSIESFKFFPVIAWTVVILFASFVYILTTKLNNVTTAIEANTQQLTEFNEGLRSLQKNTPMP